MAKLYHVMVGEPEYFEGTPAEALPKVIEQWIKEGLENCKATIKRIDEGFFTHEIYTPEFLAERRAGCVKCLETPVEELNTWTTVVEEDGSIVIYPEGCPLPQEMFVLKSDDFVETKPEA